MASEISIRRLLRQIESGLPVEPDIRLGSDLLPVSEETRNRWRQAIEAVLAAEAEGPLVDYIRKLRDSKGRT